MKEKLLHRKFNWFCARAKEHSLTRSSISLFCFISSRFSESFDYPIVLVGGCLAVLPFFTKSKKFAFLYLMVSLILTLVCAAGVLTAGVEYMTKYWALTRLSLNYGQCKVEKVDGSGKKSNDLYFLYSH